MKNNSTITKSITVGNYDCTNIICQLTLYIDMSSDDTLKVKITMI